MDKEVADKKDHWLELSFEFLRTTLTNLGKNIVEGVHEKIDAVVVAVVRQLTMMFLLILGLVFLLVGVAKFLNDLIGKSDAIGYVSVGGGLLLIVFLMSMVRSVLRR